MQWLSMTVIGCYKTESENVIHAYTTTSKYAILAESEMRNPMKIKLFYILHEHDGHKREFQYPIYIKLRNELMKRHTFPSVRHLEVIRTPIISIKRNKLLNVAYHLVIGTIDGIMITTLENFISTDQEPLTVWKHDNMNDVINCVYCQSHKNGTIEIVMGTVLGKIIDISFNVRHGKFTKMNETRNSSVLQKCQQLMNDSIISVNGLRDVNDGANFKTSKDDELWVRNSITEALVFGCFDNYLYGIIDGKVENQCCYENVNNISNLASSPSDMNQERLGSLETSNNMSDHILTDVDFVIAKQYSSSSLRFYVANVTNIGCILYRRTNRGEWDKLRVFKRYTHSEKSPQVNCRLQLLPTSNELQIFSGSEDGKLFQWRYDYINDTVISKIVSINNQATTVHSLSFQGPNKLFFVERYSDKSSLGYFDLLLI
ncbi:hypothetical protein NCAS_0A01960 [Naumovozyma castellii]|uniref:Uncharacterized protein n=1 Tax=Naumovozyma castellii TaxID=27288 RepID=G0V5L7_NAUCA|nr:hypothetical protein NCAS_0A01960 [Naumovozyma castellii CBS 4309]CCC66754.1 hypothetical protein NCAS_0A01960 [Naumovozyma castellii CBS 4309]